MRIGKEIKRDTQLIIIAVIVLTIVTLSVSYSAFFSVKSLRTVQEIDTGDLNVSVIIDNTNSIISNGEDIYPSTIEDIKVGEDVNYSTLTLQNNGSLDSEFSVTISYDFEQLRLVDELKDKTDSELLEYLIPYNYLNVGIYDSTNGSWVNFSDSGESFYPTISSLVPTNENSNVYPILRDTISGMISEIQDPAQRVYKIYVWLSEETPITEIGKYVYLKLDVKCAVGTETITETVESQN